MTRLINKHTVLLLSLTLGAPATHIVAQTATPVVYYIDTTTETGDTIKMSQGDSQTTQAPLELNCQAGINMPDGWEAVCEWRFFLSSEGEESPLLTRFEDNTSYTLTESGSYGAKLYVTFTNTSDGSTEEYESEIFTVVISESELTCPNAFSPNDDGRNDVLRGACKSIVRLDATVFNRWGQKMVSKSINGVNGGYTENGTYYIDIWDGRYGGNYAKDGVYFLNLNAKGSDGTVYKEKKTISLIKGYNEDSESSAN